ncbi:MAG: PH domain-containing protein [Candidatus Levybacteria bacterium]|nr:PH domain-containing protein [Candidatus Levybacteria bacterium]
MPDIFVGEKQKEDLSTHRREEHVKKALTVEEKVEAGTGPLKVDKQHSHLHVFTSYCENPPTVNFADKLKNEELLLFLRKHFITNIPWVLEAIAIALIPLLLITASSFNFISIDFLPNNFIMMILLFYYLLLAGFIFVNYITWFYNISLVTNERIIDIDFSSIVFENVAATKLNQVEDVSYGQVGVIRSIFDYGDVLIQTAGATDLFEFLAVPHPERVVKIINNLMSGEENA